MYVRNKNMPKEHILVTTIESSHLSTTQGPNFGGPILMICCSGTGVLDAKLALKELLKIILRSISRYLFCNHE